MKTGFFTNGNGIFSMARLIAFLFAIIACGAIVGNLLISHDDWKVVAARGAVTVALPIIASIFSLKLRDFNLDNVTSVVKSIMKKGD